MISLCYSLTKYGEGHQVSSLILQDPRGNRTRSEEMRSGRKGSLIIQAIHPWKGHFPTMGRAPTEAGEPFALETRFYHPKRRLQTTWMALVPIRKI